MTREDIIRMAREAGAVDYNGGPHFSWEQVERFATLVAAAEREACLEIADQCADADMHASMAANAIRARSNP